MIEESQTYWPLYFSLPLREVYHDTIAFVMFPNVLHQDIAVDLLLNDAIPRTHQHIQKENKKPYLDKKAELNILWVGKKFLVRNDKAMYGLYNSLDREPFEVYRKAGILH